MRGQHIGDGGRLNHTHKGFGDIERHTFVNGRVQREGGGEHQERIAVGRRFRRKLAANDALCAGAVVDYPRLS